LIGSLISILVSDPAQRGFPHYYINWLPFIALSGAFVVFLLQSRFLRRTISSRRADWAGILLSLALLTGVFVVSGRADEYARILQRFANRDKQGIEQRSAVSIYVNNHTQPGDYVLFWSALPGENYMANREAPTASLYYPLYIPSAISTRLNDQFFRDLVEKKPALIVDMGHLTTLSLDPSERQQRIAAGLGSENLPDNINQVFAYIDQNYHKVAVVRTSTIYRLNGSEQ
jgi:hypothetical protein